MTLTAHTSDAHVGHFTLIHVRMKGLLTLTNGKSNVKRTERKRSDNVSWRNTSVDEKMKQSVALEIIKSFVRGAR